MFSYRWIVNDQILWVTLADTVDATTQHTYIQCMQTIQTSPSLIIYDMLEVKRVQLSMGMSLEVLQKTDHITTEDVVFILPREILSRSILQLAISVMLSNYNVHLMYDLEETCLFLNTRYLGDYGLTMDCASVRG